MSITDHIKEQAAVGQGLAAAQLSSLGSPLVTASGLTVKVPQFTIGGLTFQGGSISLPAAGTWFVGVEIFGGTVRCLPRTGHRGWIPLARLVCSGTVVTDIRQIHPVMPVCRIPRTMEKLRSGTPIKVLVMGSSLAESTGTDTWSGMLFNQASNVAKYRLPGTITLNNVALGGAPNQYQLAQSGFASTMGSFNYSNGVVPNVFLPTTRPSGRSAMFEGIDLVVLTVLANGGDYRLQSIEPVVRNLRKQGLEVILCTDNPQNPTQDYGQLSNSLLYVDGPDVMRIADTYGVELADTAAYVFDAYMRYPAASIYRDSIHMFSAQPAGRNVQPAGGYEVWARAIRSLFTVDANAAGTSTQAYNFESDLPSDWINYGLGTTTVAGGKLLVTPAADGLKWGTQVKIPPIKSGDTVTVVFDLGQPGVGLPSLEVGFQGGGAGWGSVVNGGGNTVGTKNITLTASRDIPSDGRVLFYVNSGASAFTLDNVTVTVNSSFEGVAYDLMPARACEARPLPRSRLVTDLKTPGDAFVILPHNEAHLIAADPNAGTLGAHPAGGGSFARRFAPSIVGAANDLLTVAAGKMCAISALGAVGFSVIHYTQAGDAAVTIDVFKDNVFQKTVTIAASTITREILVPIYSPTDWNQNSASPSFGVIDLRVTAGSLRVCALVALTFEIDFVMPEEIKRVGTWTGRVSGGAPTMIGYATDTKDDYAYVTCPPTGRRVGWIMSGKPNSKPVNFWSGRSQSMATATVGVNHIFCQGNLVGPGEVHYAQLNETLVGGGGAANGYGMHIGGVVIVNDR